MEETQFGLECRHPSPPKYLKHHPEVCTKWTWRTAYQDPHPDRLQDLSCFSLVLSHLKRKLYFHHEKIVLAFQALQINLSVLPLFLYLSSDMMACSFLSAPRYFIPCPFMHAVLLLFLACFSLANSYPSTPNSAPLHCSDLSHLQQLFYPLKILFLCLYLHKISLDNY